MAGGVPMNGPMQFPPGMQGRMMPAMAPPQMMQPGQGGMPAGWQGGSMNNQPPNAEMNSSEFGQVRAPLACRLWTR